MDLKRRDFLLKATLGAGMFGLGGSTMASDRLDLANKINDRITTRPAAGQSVIGLKTDPIKQVRVGFIGTGSRGSGHVRHYAAMYPEKGVVTAVCDIREEMANRAVKIVKEAGQKPKPAVYSGTPDAWKEMVQRDDIDLIVIATPWELHAPMAIEAMKRGKHVVTEVPVGLTLEELNSVVRTAEETQKNCMMLENVNYGNEELWILNMVRNDIFGTLTYGEGAYIHNLLTPHLFGDAYYKSWRIRHHITTDGNLYPTHGLGPIAWYMDINRGDKFDYMVSMSSLQASLTEFSKTIDPSDEFYNRDDFKHGDMNNSLIKTAKGRSILMQHDVVTHRPYSRKNVLAGTKAYHEGYPSRLSLAGKGHDWLKEEEYKAYREKFNHPIWEELKSEIEKHGGHGGMDFVMNYRVLDCLNKGLPLDMDVYDGASWSAVLPLSAISVELGSVPVKFPDYTNAAWKEKREIGIMTLS
ncbi:MAG: Gfo/Idh/MocA family oxidoreductase [Cyclobacteriaceae bacterium]|nr:Gfo/Idh/MocA family oxidoreductase [Cyclobacteriaceae bacterium]